MRHLTFVLAFFLICGIAEAAGIPTAADPANQPEIWTHEVYNNHGSALTSGQVVIWDNRRSSTPAQFTMMLPYVTVINDPDNIRVAGVVVSDAISVSGVGTICIFGPTYALVADATDAVTNFQSVATAGVVADGGYSKFLGLAGQAGAVAVDHGVLGWCIDDSPVSTDNGGYGGSDGVDGIMLPIFVNPTSN